MEKALLAFFIIILSFPVLHAQQQHRMTGPIAKNYKKFQTRNAYVGVGVKLGTSTPVIRKIKTFQHRKKNYTTNPSRFYATRKWFNGEKGPKAKNFKPWRH